MLGAFIILGDAQLYLVETRPYSTIRRPSAITSRSGRSDIGALVRVAIAERLVSDYDSALIKKTMSPLK